MNIETKNALLDQLKLGETERQDLTGVMAGQQWTPNQLDQIRGITFPPPYPAGQTIKISTGGPTVGIFQIHETLIMKVTSYTGEDKQIALNEFGSNVVINLPHKYSILSLRDLLIKEMPLTLEEINALTPAAVKEVLTR